MAEGAVFGLHYTTISSEFRKGFDGTGEFGKDFSADSENGFVASRFANFHTENLDDFVAGFKAGGKFWTNSRQGTNRRSDSAIRRLTIPCFENHLPCSINIISLLINLGNSLTRHCFLSRNQGG